MILSKCRFSFGRLGKGRSQSPHKYESSLECIVYNIVCFMSSFKHTYFLFCDFFSYFHSLVISKKRQGNRQYQLFPSQSRNTWNNLYHSLFFLHLFNENDLNFLIACQWWIHDLRASCPTSWRTFVTKSSHAFRYRQNLPINFQRPRKRAMVTTITWCHRRQDRHRLKNFPNPKGHPDWNCPNV